MANVPDPLFLRKVIPSDEEFLFNWANDSETRKWSFNSKAITPGEHKEWFESKIDNPNVVMWILEKLNTPAGLVRLEKKDEAAVLNYLIAPDERGKGLAGRMLKMAMEKKRDYWENMRVLAYTLPENIPSIQSLEKSGFYLKRSDKEKNCYVYAEN